MAWPRHSAERLAIVLLLCPALLVFLGLIAYPLALTAFNSLHEVAPGRSPVWVGFAHYSALASDPAMAQAVRNTLVWALSGPLLEIALALLLALALTARVPGRAFFRVVWFAPVLMSYAVVGLLWMWIFNFDWGSANALLASLGLGGLRRDWLGDPDTALGALILVTTWKWVGFNFVAILAALTTVPRGQLDLAELDGCTRAEAFFLVELPQILPVLASLLALSFIGKMKSFEIVWVTTRGTPLWSTETVATYAYKRAFDWSSFDLGYPSAIAMVWAGATVALILCVRLLAGARLGGDSAP